MRQNALAAAIALVSLACPMMAGAVGLNPRGIGQVLIYPYYTVNKSQDTLVSVVNVSGVSKAVQVRFVEGYNGRDTLDFVLYLSPHDVWTAAISQTADDGGAVLKTSDTSCTFPAIPATGAPFLSSGYDGSGSAPADGGPTAITRTREGSIEFLAGADITTGSPTDIAITHVQNGNPGVGIPPGCATLTATSALADEAAPTGGILGSGTIINVGEGTFFAYDAQAIQGFTSIPLFAVATDGVVSLADANSDEALGAAARAYMTVEDGVPFWLDYEFGIDAVSAVLTADAIYNEYFVAASLGATTDWVVTFPTKNFYVDKGLYPANHTEPFVEPFNSQQSGVSYVVTPTTSYDREEGLPSVGCGFPCPASPPQELAYQVNVVPFTNDANFSLGTPSGVLGSTLTSLQIPPYGDDGYVAMDLASGDGGEHQLPGGIDINRQGVTLNGLPVTGFMVYNIINAQAQPGLLANYGGAFVHRATASCVGDTVNCAH
ncbi:MAG TPA: hypothetical protein VGO25_12855 [Rhodanobacteraceae bacterium]|nr:hypothetical protein [Rhodanobacteraceae bacterium]